MAELGYMMHTTDMDALSDIKYCISAPQYDKIIGIGAGRMGYSLRAFMMRLSHMSFDTYFIGDTSLPRINEKSLVIINSSSGETETNILYARQAMAAGSFILTFTCNPDSTIGKLSNHVFKIPTIKSKQLMKSIYEQYTYLIFDMIVADYVEYFNLDTSVISQNHSILE